MVEILSPFHEAVIQDTRNQRLLCNLSGKESKVQYIKAFQKWKKRSLGLALSSLKDQNLSV
jgi:hypothetical protein